MLAMITRAPAGSKRMRGRRRWKGRSERREGVFFGE